MNYDSFENYLNLASESAHQNAHRHGFYQDIENLIDYCFNNDLTDHAETAKRDFVLAQLAKISSEIGEAVSVIQKEKQWDHLAEELADIVIRTMDLSYWLGYSLGTEVTSKMQRNALRPWMHGKQC